MDEIIDINAGGSLNINLLLVVNSSMDVCFRKSELESYLFSSVFKFLRKKGKELKKLNGEKKNER